MASVEPNPVTQWELLQNDPNPFCPQVHGVTGIQFAAPQSADIELSIWDPASTHVVRQLALLTIVAGFHMVLWDGRDDDGNLLPPGDYPYELRATDGPGGDVLFDDTKIISLDCAAPAPPMQWGHLKALFE